MLPALAIIGPVEIQVSQLDTSNSRLPEAILGFAGTLIWSFLAFVAIIIFRKPIASFLSSLGGKLTKLSIAGVELEWSAAPDATLSEDAKSFGSMDPQALASSSTSQTLVNALNGPVIPDSYVVIDLGMGKSWLISRLFIFAIMLKQVRGVRCFAFVDRSAGVPSEYLGTISTDLLRAALAQRYPWLETVYAKSYKDRLWPGYMVNSVTSIGSLDSSFAVAVVQEFVALLKKDRDWVKAPPGQSPTDPPPEATFQSIQNQIANGPWVQVGSSTEYGAWINRELFFELFKGVVSTDQIPLSAKAAEKVREVINSPAPFVATVRYSGQFAALIDRTRVADELAKTRSEEA